MSVNGAKIADSDIYIWGFDNGFPHRSAHVKIDLITNCIAARHGAHDCPIEVRDNVYE